MKRALLVAHPLGDARQALVGVGHSHRLGLPAVYAAAQGPAAVGVGAVVHEAPAAEVALAAEGLHVHRHAVARSHAPHRRAHGLHHAHHLVPHGHAGHRPRHAAVLYVQVAGADACQRDAHQCVALVPQHRAGLLQQLEPPAFHVSICQHSLSHFSGKGSKSAPTLPPASRINFPPQPPRQQLKEVKCKQK